VFKEARAVSVLASVQRKRPSDKDGLLDFNPLRHKECDWWAVQGSNLRPLPCEGVNRPFPINELQLSHCFSVSLCFA